MTVWNTIANMKTLDASLGSFFQVLEGEIGNQNCWIFDGSESLPNLKSPNGWYRHTAHVRYSLRRIPRGEGRKRGPGNLTVSVELWREVSNQDNLWEHAKRPLIYVGFSPRKDYWSDDMALDCRGSSIWYTDEGIVPPEDNNPYLWTWSGDNEDRWSLRNWFFVLQLCTIERREDIEREIISPVRSLLVDNGDRNSIFHGKQAVRTVAVADPRIQE